MPRLQSQGGSGTLDQGSQGLAIPARSGRSRWVLFGLSVSGNRTSTGRLDSKNVVGLKTKRTYSETQFYVHALLVCCVMLGKSLLSQASTVNGLLCPSCDLAGRGQGRACTVKCKSRRR